MVNINMRLLVLLPFLCAFALAVPSAQKYGHKASKREEDHAHDRVQGVTGGRRAQDVLEDSSFWNNLAQEDLAVQLAKTPIVKQAKNIIFFLGDGHSIASFTAARLLKGQMTQEGERQVMEYEKFPDSCLIKTYNTDKQVTDSASSATAYLTGVKTNQHMVGVDINVKLNDCDAANDKSFWTRSILDDYVKANRSTGIVTTTRVTHATPSGTYAHTSNRNWESDDDINEEGVGDPEQCDDIAEQLILGEVGSQIKVILGGGRKKFLPKDAVDPEGEDSGRRDDGKNLIETWIEDKSFRGNAKYMWHRDELLAADTADMDYLLGLFDYSHMAYHVDEMSSNPTLEEMTRAALNVLQKDDSGYFLLVEGGLIDRAHHISEYRSAMEEALEFEKAIKLAVEMTDEQDTLIVVTADHAHTLTINGYSDRGDDILGFGDISTVDHKPWTTLMYTNGPGYKGYDSQGERPDPSFEDYTNPHYAGATAVPDESANHSGEDVLLYALGPHSHLFSGIHENAYITHALRYASCMGDGLKFCDERKL